MNTQSEKYTYTNFGHDIEIQVTPLYLSERSNPLVDYYFFQYRLKIINHTKQSLRLKKRKWTINCKEQKEKIEHGDGLSHMDFLIHEGAVIEVSSFCSLPCPYGNIRGQLKFADPQGKEYKVFIPLFFLRPPLH